MPLTKCEIHKHFDRLIKATLDVGLHWLPKYLTPYVDGVLRRYSWSALELAKSPRLRPEANLVFSHAVNLIITGFSKLGSMNTTITTTRPINATECAQIIYR